MGREIKIALSSLLFLALACNSQASVNTTVPFEVWSVAATFCGETGAPDGKCTVGQNGDVALKIRSYLQDINQNELATGDTDSDGQVNLSARIPTGNSLYLGYPNTVTIQGIEGFFCAPENPALVRENGTAKEFEVPFKPCIKPETGPSL